MAVLLWFTWKINLKCAFQNCSLTGSTKVQCTKVIQVCILYYRIGYVIECVIRIEVIQFISRSEIVYVSFNWKRPNARRTHTFYLKYIQNVHSSIIFFLFEYQIKVVLKCHPRYYNSHYDFSGNNRNALRHSNRKPFSNEVEINDDLWIFVCFRILIFIFPHLRSDIWKYCFTRSVMFQIHSIYF